MHVKEFHIPYTNAAVQLVLYIDLGSCWSVHIPISLACVAHMWKNFIFHIQMQLCNWHYTLIWAHTEACTSQFLYFFGLCCVHMNHFHSTYTNAAMWLVLYIDPGMYWSVHIPVLVFFLGLCCMHVKHFHFAYTNTVGWLVLYIDPGMHWSMHNSTFIFFLGMLCTHVNSFIFHIQMQLHN